MGGGLRAYMWGSGGRSAQRGAAIGKQLPGPGLTGMRVKGGRAARMQRSSMCSTWLVSVAAD